MRYLEVTETYVIDQGETKKEYKLDIDNMSDDFAQDFLHIFGSQSAGFVGVFAFNEFIQKLIKQADE